MHQIGPATIWPIILHGGSSPFTIFFIGLISTMTLVFALKMADNPPLDAFTQDSES